MAQLLTCSNAVAGDKQAIEAVLQDYRKALNASSTEQVMKLYADDGIFMPQHFPTIIGSDAIRGAYDQIFSAITLTVEFKIAEVVVTASEWAFARTASAGQTKDHASGAVSKEGNQELFVFRKVGDEWKIARSVFQVLFLYDKPPKVVLDDEVWPTLPRPVPKVVSYYQITRYG